jgi:hypothetical protein
MADKNKRAGNSNSSRKTVAYDVELVDSELNESIATIRAGFEEMDLDKSRNEKDKGKLDPMLQKISSDIARAQQLIKVLLLCLPIFVCR